MPVSTACSSCAAKIKVKDELVGKSIKCPKCGKVFKVAAEGETQKIAVTAAAAPAPKKPAPAWGDDEDDDKAEWDKKKGKADDGKKSKPSAEEKPKAKAKAKKDDDDDDDDDDDKQSPRDQQDSEFEALLAQTLLPETTKKLVRNELKLRERGVWIGQPDVKIMTVRAVPKVILGVFVVTVFAIVLGVVGGFGLENIRWLGPAVAGFGWIVLTPLIAIGIPLMDRRKAQATAYVITNKRCICFYGRWFGAPSQESYYPDLLQHLRRMQSWFFGADAGDLVFRSVTTITTTTGKHGTSTSSSTVYYGFLGIRGLDEIEAKIRKALLSDDDDDEDDDD
jgi:predicted Zn finger-like uncharacterized protein